MTDLFRLAQCPRCTNWCNMAAPALSRKDNKTAICSACGTDEAMREYLQIPEKEWIA
jgi:transcription elongation factor Elf1